MANTVEITGTGIEKNLGLPKMSPIETTLVNLALNDLWAKQKMVKKWYVKFCSSAGRLDASKQQFFSPRAYECFDDCAYANV